MRRGIAASPLATYSAGLVSRNNPASGLGNRLWVESFNRDTPYSPDSPQVASDLFFDQLPEVVAVAGWRLVRQLVNTGSATQDFTVPGIGTPVAAIVINSIDANGNGTPTGGKYVSVAVIAAGYQGGIAGYSRNGTARCDSVNYGFEDNVVYLPKTSVSFYNIGAGTFIQDGLRITWSVKTLASVVDVILFYGPNLQASAGSIQPFGAALVNTGFAPDVLFALSSVDLIGPTVRDTFNLDMFLGVRAGGTNYPYWTRSQDNDATSMCATVTDAPGIICANYTETAGVITIDASQTLFTSWATNGFNISGSGTPNFIFLALRFGGKQVYASILDTPAATGNVSYHGSGMTPAFALTLMSRLTTWPSNSVDDKAGPYGVSAFNAAGEAFSNLTVEQDNQANMNTASISHTKAYYLTTDAQAEENTATWVSFAPNTVTLNFSAVNAGRKFVTLLVERDFHSGTSSMTAGHVTVASTGLEVFRGTSAGSAGHVTIASTGLEVFRGTSSLSAGHVSIASTGIEVFRGTAAGSAGHVTVTSAGLEVFRSTSSLTAGHVTIASTGLEVFRGSSSLTAGHVSLSAAGLEVFRSTASLTAGHVTVASTGLEVFRGAASLTAGHVTVSASGAEDLTGTAALTAGHISISSTGLEIFRGAASLVGPHVSIASAGLEIFRGAADLTGPHVTTSSSGSTATDGSAVLTGPHSSISAAGLEVFRGACSLLGPHPQVYANDLPQIGCVVDMLGSEDALVALAGSSDSSRGAQGSWDAVGALSGSTDAAVALDGSYDAERDLRGSNC